MDRHISGCLNPKADFVSAHFDDPDDHRVADDDAFVLLP